MSLSRVTIGVASLCLAAFCALPASAARVDEPFKEATPAELAMKSVPLAPGAPAVVLLWTDHQDDDDGVESEYFRIKILTDEGKKQADIELAYLPRITEIRNIKARTIRPDGSIVDFKDKIYDKVVVKGRGVALRAKSFTLPEVQVGSIIEYRYVRGRLGNVLYDTNWEVQRDIPVLKASLDFHPYSSPDIHTAFVYAGIPKGKEPTIDRQNIYHLELENLPPFEEESFSPPPGTLKPWVTFYYSNDRLNNVEKFWKQTADDLTGEVEKFIGKPSALQRDVVAATVAPTDTPMAKAKKLYDRVQRIRNLDNEAAKTEQEQKKEKIRDNNNVDDVLRNGYASGWDFNKTFVALARIAGLNADVVQTAPRSNRFFAKNVPNQRQLHGQIVAVDVDGKPVYLDPASSYSPFGMISWAETSVTALRLHKGAAAPQWVTTPNFAPEESKSLRKADLKLEGEVIKGTVRYTYSGQEALNRRVAHREDDEAAVKKELEEAAKKRFPDGAVVKLTKVTGIKNADETLVEEYEVELPNLSSTVGSRQLVPLAVFQSRATNPFSAASRHYPIFYDYLYATADEVNLTLPEGMSVESLPKPVALDLKSMNYLSQYFSKGNVVTFQRSYQVNAPYFDPNDYPVIRNFHNKIASADQETAVLRAKP
jgi:transglutaminase-like putative cysteine protease